MKKEFKIGLLAIIVLTATFFVINFLRGRNLFSDDYVFVSFYEDVQGLLPSSPVYIKGYKAGTVSEVEYNREKKGFDVVCSVSRDFEIPADSKMTIYSADLMGGKALRIDLGQSEEPARDGAFLAPSVSHDMLTSLAAGIEPLITKGKDVLENLDSALINLNLTLSEENRASLRSIMRNMERTMAKVESLASTVEGSSSDITSLIGNLDTLSHRLNLIAEKADTAMTGIAGTAAELDEADIRGLVESLKTLSGKMQENDGTIGRLVNDDSVYNSLDSLLLRIDGILCKIEENPKKYLRISVF